MASGRFDEERTKIHISMSLTQIEARELLVRADPETFFVTEHYRNYPSVLARLDRLSAADLRKLLARAVGRS